MAVQDLSFRGVALRFFAATVIVFATFNPEGYSYYHWAVLNWDEFDPIKALAGIVLLIGWTVFLRATARSLGVFGLVLASAFFAAIVWGLIYYGFIATDSSRTIMYLSMFMVAGVLTAGMVWSMVRRRMSGQLDVGEVDGI